MNEHDKPCFSERAGSITSGRAKTTFLSIPRGRSRPVQHSPVSAWITGLAPVAFAVWVATVGLPPAAFAQSPQLINYQGRLLSGTNLVNGNVGLALRLFNVPVGGSALYVDSNTVPVADGLYSTFIGDNTVSGSLADALANPSVWIEVAVNGVALAPRERLASAAYAVGAWNVNGNAGTTSNSFIGTTDLTPLEMRVNGMRAMRL
ncbi:MAG: hypothetical protein NT167_30940, partial [Verrucomicrobia bacterium]|nr:hypothetical protein [Verrucomicrobiota bacterium]